jgi:nitrogen-specific signal transduction histidine kinase
MRKRDDVHKNQSARRFTLVETLVAAVGGHMELNDLLAHEDILHLTSLREVFGGFAHEIAQPLNAIMIATQVIQLKLDRSLLTEEEKGFLKQRLSIVTGQAQRATQIVENLRVFSRGSPCGAAQKGIRAAFQAIHGLMGQQFVGRGIQLTWECAELPPGTCENMHLIEGVIVQALAFARDSVSAISSWHEEKGMLYKKKVDVRIAPVDSRSRMAITWDLGELPPTYEMTGFANRAGLFTASSVIAGLGGRLEPSASELTIDFP